MTPRRLARSCVDRPASRGDVHVRTFQVGHDQAQEGRPRRQARQDLHQDHPRDDHRRPHRRRRRRLATRACAPPSTRPRRRTCPPTTSSAPSRRAPASSKARRTRRSPSRATARAASRILVEGTTDNRNRTVSEIRHIFTKHGGNLGGAGQRLLHVQAHAATSRSPRTRSTEEKLMELALEAGADDIHGDGEIFEVYTLPERLRGRADGAQEGRASSPTSRRSASTRRTTSPSRAPRPSRC